MICITGDLVDMTSFEEDVINFAEKLTQIPTKYGIYYVEGNHEADSDIDCEKILEKYGIVCLYDEAVTLENGIVMVGRKDNVEMPVSEILHNSSIPEDRPVVVLSHQPIDFNSMQDHSYLVLSGHTHGFQIADDELIAYVLFRRNKSIRWDEIKEVWIGQVFTPTGIQFCAYFANSPLSYEEVDNLDLAGKKCIYLRTLTRENYESVCRYCPEEELILIRKWVQPE